MNLIQTLSTYHPVMHDVTPHTASVMLLLLQDEKNQYALVLTKRSATLPNYAGDYCFPGGMRNAEDKDLRATAVREISEELNVHEIDYEIIAQLDDFYDHYGNLVRPFVALMPQTKFLEKYKEAKEEIAELFYLPLSELNQITEVEWLKEITPRRPAYAYEVDQILVWGLTAAILVHLREVIG